MDPLDLDELSAMSVEYGFDPNIEGGYGGGGNEMGEPWWMEDTTDNRKRAREYNEEFYAKKTSREIVPESGEEAENRQDVPEDAERDRQQQQLLDSFSVEERQASEFVQRYGHDLVLNPESRERLIELHNQSDLGKRFEIKDTQYGKGLFSRNGLSIGDEVGTYSGPEIPLSVTEQLPDNYDKVINSARRGYAIVGDIHLPGQHPNYVSFANDPGFSGSKKTGIFQNAPSVQFEERFDNAAGKMVVKMIVKRPIAPGGEITVYYGYDYWKDDPNYWPDKQTKKDAKRQRDRNAKGKA